MTCTDQAINPGGHRRRWNHNTTLIDENAKWMSAAALCFILLVHDG